MVMPASDKPDSEQSRFNIDWRFNMSRTTSTIGNSPAAATKRPASAKPSAKSTQISQDQIAKRAYEIYKSGRGGSPQEHWLQAESELKNLAA
jgi:Protein of unknown function (DUF2934)